MYCIVLYVTFYVHQKPEIAIGFFKCNQVQQRRTQGVIIKF